MRAVRDVHTLTLHRDVRPSTANDCDSAALGHRVCSGLASMRTLRALKHEGRLDTRTAEQFAAALSHLSQLVHLNLHRNEIHDDAAAWIIPALGCLTSLTFLDLSRNPFTARSFQRWRRC